MSHGRQHSPHPRAPVADAIDAAPSPLRIGPPELLSAHDWHERGIKHEMVGDFDAAIECYREALRVGGPDVQVIFDLAYALAEAGQHAAAIERYWQVIELDGNRQDAWVNLGDLLVSEGHLEAGRRALRHAVALSPNDPAARHNLADTQRIQAVDCDGRQDT